jgi:hypothetical protein
MDHNKETKTFYYFEEDNHIVDENGQIVYDIFRYITPSQLYLFKKDYRHNYFNMVGNNSIFVEIIPNDHYEYLYV